jgi:hypothetical protein
VAQMAVALHYKPEGSIPDEVIGIIYWQSFRPHYGPGVDSTSNRNEYEYLLAWGRGGRCVGLTTLSPSCADCLEILGASTSSSHKGLSSPVMGQVYLYLYLRHLQANGEIVPKLQTGNKYRPSQFTLITNKHIDLQVLVAALRRTSAAARQLKLWVRIPPPVRLSVSCVLYVAG